MIHAEVARIIEDLKRATTFVSSPETAEQRLECVADNVAKIIERMEQSQRGKLYRSIYSSSRR